MDVEPVPPVADPGVVLEPAVLVDEPPAGATVPGWLAVPAGGEPAIVFVEPPQPTPARQATRNAMDSAQDGRNTISGVWPILRVLFS